jgi:hypothetical protein
VLTKSAMDGFDPNDRRGKEGITAEDVRKGLAAIEDDADIPVVGELRRENSAFRIVCAFGAVCRQTTLYRRALADAHRVRDQRTPLSAVGADLEKLCDNLAARSSCQEPRLSPLLATTACGAQWKGVRCTVSNAFLRLRPRRWAFSSLGPALIKARFPEIRLR